MKTTLNQNLILSLKIDAKPLEFAAGKVVKSEPNTKKSPYIVYDNHKDAPTGFGVKVAGTKTTYIIQKKVQGKAVKVKVGNLTDYTLENARLAAKEKLGKLLATGKNPNVTEREEAIQAITLGECFDRYLTYLEGKNQKPTENTKDAIAKARRKLADWEKTKVQDLSSDQIIKRFDEIATKTPTTAEQTFRWANVAVERVIEREAFEAKRQSRKSRLELNPFEILRIEKKYRTRKQLEDSYEMKEVRKPLSAKTHEGPNSLKSFLEAVWERRKENRTGCDYILCCLLWGTRKSEAADLQWRVSLTDMEARSQSWVDLKERKVFFFDTKARTNHSLPLTDAIYEILSQRFELRLDQHESKQKWVFPARSKFSKTGHYTDARTLLEYIAEDAKITKRAPHDFRRTFSTVAEELCSWGMLKRLIGHADRSDPTERYPKMEWVRIIENLQRIEAHILATAPVVYNALLSPKYPPIAL